MAVNHTSCQHACLQQAGMVVQAGKCGVCRSQQASNALMSLRQPWCYQGDVSGSGRKHCNRPRIHGSASQHSTGVQMMGMWAVGEAPNCQHADHTPERSNRWGRPTMVTASLVTYSVMSALLARRFSHPGSGQGRAEQCGSWAPRRSLPLGERLYA